MSQTITLRGKKHATLALVASFKGKKSKLKIYHLLHKQKDGTLIDSRLAELYKHQKPLIVLRFKNKKALSNILTVLEQMEEEVLKIEEGGMIIEELPELLSTRIPLTEITEETLLDTISTLLVEADRRGILADDARRVIKLPDFKDGKPMAKEAEQ